jgi:hypothetical protein
MHSAALVIAIPKKPQRSGGDEESLMPLPRDTYSGIFLVNSSGIPHFVRNDKVAVVFIIPRSRCAAYFLVIPKKPQRSGGDEESLMPLPRDTYSDIFLVNPSGILHFVRNDNRAADFTIPRILSFSCDVGLLRKIGIE